FPLVSLRREPGHRSFRALLASGAVTDAPSRHLTLFPFVFWRDDVEHGSQLGVLPFYLRLDGFFGWEEMETIAFPLWLRVRSGGVARRFHPFPFVSTVRSAPADRPVDGSAPGATGASGFRVWPFFGITDVPGREHTHYVLWPFWIDQERWAA